MLQRLAHLNLALAAVTPGVGEKGGRTAEEREAAE